VRLQTPRLLIRDFCDADAEDAFELYSDDEVNRGIMGTAPSSVEQMRENLRAVRGKYADLNGMGVWAVELCDARKMIGTCLLKPLPNSEKVEIGWHLNRAFWGYGFATEFASAALHYGFETLMLDRIYAILFEWNLRSWNVAVRIGLKHQGQTNEFHNQTLELFVAAREEYLRSKV